MQCHSCHSEISTLGAIGFREECSKCKSDLHVCKNCEFYSVNHKWECRESIDERVGEKDRANFCGFFAPLKLATGASGPAKNDLLSAAEALFKKKPD